jgi:hypothetical protein
VLECLGLAITTFFVAAEYRYGIRTDKWLNGNQWWKATMQSDQIRTARMIVYTSLLLQTPNAGCRGGQMLCTFQARVSDFIPLSKISTSQSSSILHFYPENGISGFLRNVGIYPQNKGSCFMVQGVNRISPRITECYLSAVNVGFAVGKVTL